MEDENFKAEEADPSVDGDLLDLHTQLEEAGLTPGQFKEAMDAG